MLLLLEPAGRNYDHRWQEDSLYQTLATNGHIVCIPDLRGVGDMKPELGRGAASGRRSTTAKNPGRGRRSSWGNRCSDSG